MPKQCPHCRKWIGPSPDEIKERRREYDHGRYLANREKRKARWRITGKLYYQANRKAILARKKATYRQWYLKNRLKKTAAARAYYQANRDSIREKDRLRKRDAKHYSSSLLYKVNRPLRGARAFIAAQTLAGNAR